MDVFYSPSRLGKVPMAKVDMPLSKENQHDNPLTITTSGNLTIPI